MSENEYLYALKVTNSTQKVITVTLYRIPVTWPELRQTLQEIRKRKSVPGKLGEMDQTFLRPPTLLWW